MQPAHHHFSELFDQLGLPSEPAAIDRFLQAHAPLPRGMDLPDAPFWSPSQATFLREAWLQDSDWAEPVDRLSAALRAKPRPASVLK